LFLEPGIEEGIEATDDEHNIQIGGQALSGGRRIGRLMPGSTRP